MRKYVGQMGTGRFLINKLNAFHSSSIIDYKARCIIFNTEEEY